MKEIISNLNKLFENRIRLGIMSILMVNEWVKYNQLKDLLKVTDGNLASHLKALEKNNLIKVRKQFIDRKPNTQYTATEKGKKAFQEHLNYMEKLIKSQNR